MVETKRTEEVIEIAPQPGPQTTFFETPADIAVYGGAAGGGKTFSLLVEPLRHYEVKGFGGVIFRREGVQIRNEGGLWDASGAIYGPMQGRPREQQLDWKFPTGMRMRFAHLELDRTVEDWLGSEIPYIGFDELTHFTERQFWYMLSRNRSTCGINPYVRATCNPDADSWVRKLIDWWIDKDGFAIPERSGVVRWFVRKNDKLEWADSAEELYQRFGRGKDVQPLSFTFIAAKLEDNKVLMEKNPRYIANLENLHYVDRERLLGGNWNIRLVAGSFFKREWFRIVDAVPPTKKSIRYWDRASTEPSPDNKNPDYTAGLRLDELMDGRFCVRGVTRGQVSPGGVEKMLLNTASQDGISTMIGLEQDPGQAGKADALNLTKLLRGYEVRIFPARQDKATRAKPASAALEHGLILLERGPWNHDFIEECVAFSGGTQKAKDDQVDALSGAYNALTKGGVATFSERMSDAQRSIEEVNQEW